MPGTCEQSVYSFWSITVIKTLQLQGHLPISVQRLLLPKVKGAGKGNETVLLPLVLCGYLQCIGPTFYEVRS